MKTQQITQNKILKLSSLKNKLALHHFKQDKIVFTNGCFDLLHQGHLQLLQDCADLGDVLIVGLNSDASVKRLKGPQRPIHSEDTRSLMLAALHFVDYVVLFEEDTPKKLIENIVPNVLVKGGDYKKVNIVGAEFVESKGGEVVVIPLVEGYSTTQLIEKVMKGTD